MDPRLFHLIAFDVFFFKKKKIVYLKILIQIYFSAVQDLLDGKEKEGKEVNFLFISITCISFEFTKIN